MMGEADHPVSFDEKGFAVLAERVSGQGKRIAWVAALAVTCLAGVGVVAAWSVDEAEETVQTHVAGIAEDVSELKQERADSRSHFDQRHEKLMDAIVELHRDQKKVLMLLRGVKEDLSEDEK